MFLIYMCLSINKDIDFSLLLQVPVYEIILEGRTIDFLKNYCLQALITLNLCARSLKMIQPYHLHFLLKFLSNYSFACKIKNATGFRGIKENIVKKVQMVNREFKLCSIVVRLNDIHIIFYT